MTHTGSSSTKAHSGSQKGSSSSTSSTSHKHKHISSFSSTKKKSSEDRVERFVQDERDHRSLAVEEFDAHQEAAKQSHVEKLKDVVKKEY
ncbi:hypothetical protein ACEPPN_005404 [Leptodophora sp. 'Broadleaf-Isolate-01']